MDREAKCIIGEVVGELILGSTIGIITNNVLIPKCNTTVEKMGVALGAVVGSWMLGRAWGKTYLKWYDCVFDTDHKCDIDNL